MIVTKAGFQVMGQREKNARSQPRYGRHRGGVSACDNSFAITVSRMLTGVVVCVFGVTNALAQTSEKIIVLPEKGIPSCELTDSVIRFRIEGEEDAVGNEADASEMAPAAATDSERSAGGSGRLDIRSAESNALIGQVRISPATVSEPVDHRAWNL
ncbi:MAG: hypothetical protein ACF8AM_13460 [Rhodopirellula sp. JB055]|uniref:hypothetical protein n=1 Tax=Rhodopirellula sp. JB055 TaxID=3342846 RepID=UPI00370AF252